MTEGQRDGDFSTPSPPGTRAEVAIQQFDLTQITYCHHFRRATVGTIVVVCVRPLKENLPLQTPTIAHQKGYKPVEGCRRPTQTTDSNKCYFRSNKWPAASQKCLVAGTASALRCRRCCRCFCRLLGHKREKLESLLLLTLL